MNIYRNQVDISKIPKTRVELHLHLDGSIRLSTIWDLAQKKNIRIGQQNTIVELRRLCKVDKPTNLSDFLKKFSIFLPTIVGDKEAIERVAYELCEDEARDKVAYFEARYCPHFLSNTVSHHFQQEISANSDKAVSPRDVVEAVNRGLMRGQQDFGVKANSILCLICGHSKWAEEILNLAFEFRDKGVVGIDIAGDECNDESRDMFDSVDLKVFQMAKQMQIHRTVHAAENGPANRVAFAIDEMCAERIGHGYHVVSDNFVYLECLNKNIHFETCPHSSYYTGSVDFDRKHPIVKFAEDNANFSINKDDTTPIQVCLDDEYELLRQFGLNESHFVRANINAAKAAFIPRSQKQQLIKQLYDAYGIQLIE